MADSARISAGRPIVGRERQLDRLYEALRGAEDSHGELVLLSGVAGIGKTRLAEALAERASEHADTVLWSSAWEGGGAPPYWPWNQVVRELVRDRPLEQLQADVGRGGEHVAQIAPELAARLEIEPAARSPLDTEAARFAIFDATASFLAAAAARRPILIVIDDLHAADAASVRFLEFLARTTLRSAPILAVATYRLDGDDGASLSLLERASQGPVEQLAGLTRDDVSALVVAETRHAPKAGLADRLHTLTEGNPLFVHQLLRLLTAEGAWDQPGGPSPNRLRTPVAMREMIRRRLEPLDPAIVSTITTAAVVGPEFRLEILVHVLDEAPGHLLLHLDTAAAVGLIAEIDTGTGRYRFAHPLMRETLYDDLSGHDRAVLHTAVGEALLEIHGDSAQAPLSELAHHFICAAPTDPRRAADYAERAGRQALQATAYEPAIELFRDGLRALDMLPADLPRRGALQFAMGQAEMRAGKLDDGRQTLRAAAGLAREAGDPELLAQAALEASPWGLATGMADEEGLIPLLEEAIARLPREPGALRARLLARLAAAQYWTSPPEHRRARAEEAIAVARAVGDPATLAAVLSDAHRATWDPDSPVRALSWADEIHALATQVGNTELAMLARAWRISLLLELGRIERVDQEMESFARAAKQLHQPRARLQALVHSCARAAIAGRFDEANALIGEAYGYSGLLEQDELLTMRLSALAFVMCEVQGTLGLLKDAVKMFAAQYPAMPVWRCGLLCVYMQDEDPELRREWRRFAADGFAGVPRDNLWLPAMALLSEVAAHLGDRRAASELRRLLTPFEGRNVVTPDIAFIGPVDRYLALLAATEGDTVAAARWFASARTLANAMGAQPTLDRLAADEARLLEQRPPEPTAPGTALLRHCGEMWEIRGGGAVFHLKDAKGLRHLARLLASPGEVFRALDLAAPLTPGVRMDAASEGLTVHADGQAGAGPALDEQAKREYRRRIAELRDEIDEAKRFNDPERAARLEDEYEALTDEISGAVGRFQRDRPGTGSHAERARISVTKAIRESVKRIRAYDAELGHHLDTCVHTGGSCVYEPGPRGPVWQVEP